MSWLPAVISGKKKPARRLAFLRPKAGEDLLLRRVSSRGGSRSSSSGSSGRSSSRSGGSRSSSSVSGLRSVSGRSGSRSRSSSGRRSGSGSGGGFGLAASGHSQGEEGSYEERVFHFSEILNVMEIHGQLVDLNVAVSVNK